MRRTTPMPLYAGILLAMHAAPAISQEQAGSGVFTGVEEVIVTAQKREQNANDVGMTIDTASGDAINAAGITDTFDLGKLISGFTANMNYYGSVTYTMRGIGFQDTALASPQTISVAIDEMPIPFSAMTGGAILDLERVEVLKGPQGTLFGRNATGGVISFFSKKPSFEEFEGFIQADYGQFDVPNNANQYAVEGAFGGPISATKPDRVCVLSITTFHFIHKILLPFCKIRKQVSCGILFGYFA